MKFGDLYLSNFMTIGEAKINLADQGLVHVFGENLDDTASDSNGAGKSTLAEGLDWILWGATAKGVTGDEVVNTEVGKNTEGWVVADDEGDLYRITRYRKHSKGKNNLTVHKLEGGKEIDLTKGTNKLTQELVERIIGCSKEVFDASVYSGQENLPDIPKMTDKQLKLLVEQAAGVDVLAQAYEIARGRARIFAEKRADAQFDYDRSLTRHEDATVRLERLSEAQGQWEVDQKAKIEGLKKRTREAVQEFKDAQAAFDPDEGRQIDISIKKARAAIDAVKEEQDRERTLQKDVDRVKNALATLDQQIAVDKRVRERAIKAVQTANAGLVDAKASIGKPCKSCGRKLEKEHLAEVVAAAERAVEEAAAEERQANDALEAKNKSRPKLVEAVGKAVKALEAHRDAMTDVTAENERLTNLMRERDLHKAVANEIERLRTAARNIGEELKREAAAANPYHDMIAEADKELIELADELKAKKKALLAAIEDEKYAQAVVDVYAPAGVRAHRLDEATPYLNDRTAHYLGSLADGAIEAYWTTLTETKAGELREKFSVTVEKKGSAPSFAALSGGEKRRVRLACALALQDLVAARASKSIELWIGDEVDDALDAAGLERLMGVLEEKARDRGTVMVISHNDISDYARKAITVQKRGGKSTVLIQ